MRVEKISGRRFLIDYRLLIELFIGSRCEGIRKDRFHGAMGTATPLLAQNNNGVCLFMIDNDTKAAER